MAESFLDHIKSRRTCYPIQAKSPISDARILDIAQTVAKHTPSSFNCQSSRLVILLREHHVEFWQIAKDCFKATMPAQEYVAYEKKLDGRQEGYGTILLLEDTKVIHDYQSRFPRFANHLLGFSEHNNAMLAFNLWTALHLEGFGCNLQHVNPIVDQRVLQEWNIPTGWSLKAQLVFGLPAGEPSHEKTFVPIEQRVLVHGLNATNA